MDNSRREAIGRFGTHPVWVSRTLGSSPLTANTTNDFYLVAPPSSATIGGGAVVQNTLVADADGTVLAYLAKYDASADAVVVLTSSLDLEAMTTKEGASFTVLGTLTDAQRTFATGDTLLLRIVSNSAAINTQPTDLTVTAELFVRT